MAFQIGTERRSQISGLDDSVFVLAAADGSCRAEVWPAVGFNCFRWQVAFEGKSLDLLYSDPQLFEQPVPTRSGIPILFPFPNRIRDGRFRWAGKEFQLPCNDPAGKNAIHGFVCRQPWRVKSQGADDGNAWLAAEFRPESQSLWPADYRITITYRLAWNSLSIEALVQTLGQTPLPFGLGYHPYFHIPLVPGSTEAECRITVPTRTFWELQDCLPTGVRRPVDDARDLRLPRAISDLKLDDALTDFPPLIQQSDGLVPRGGIRQSGPGVGVQLFASPAFREMVVFTPPHRQAICLEPYTCVTDAINLQQQGVDAGLLILEPGKTWTGVVKMVFVHETAPHAGG